ncbi:MAG: 3',5'-cyclic-nucleotide phosphodiesterase [Pseudomonadota bacterium]
MMDLEPRFRWIALGVAGGLDESNLNAYLVSRLGGSAFVGLDAGCVHSGLRAAARAGCFADLPAPSPEAAGLSVEGRVCREHIQAWLISHGYLDHVHGLAEISPSDVGKPICSLDGVIDDLRDHLFNWRLWPNMADEGASPRLGQYHYTRLPPGQPVAIAGTPFSVEAHPLAHGPFTDSAAFLLESEGHSLLYMGDTGPDLVEGRSTTRDLWQRIAPLLRARTLHGLFIEASYPDKRQDAQLFSHLSPRWVMHALHELAALVDAQAPGEALRGFPVLVVHLKPDLDGQADVRARIRQQLAQRNELGVKLVFPEQGQQGLL